MREIESVRVSVRERDREGERGSDNQNKIHREGVALSLQSWIIIFLYLRIIIGVRTEQQRIISLLTFLLFE